MRDVFCGVSIIRVLFFIVCLISNVRSEEVVRGVVWVVWVSVLFRLF